MTIFELQFGSEDKTNKNSDKYEKILMKNKEFLDTTLPEKTPMVSIIILNRNGANFLKNFFVSFKNSTIYNNYEIIVIDNGSTDKSISILESESRLLPLKIIRNNENRNFSQGCNQGAEYSKGDYILLINNDTEPTYGWLNEMVKCSLRTPEVGAVCPKVLHMYDNKNKGTLVQQIGLGLKKDGGIFRPYRIGDGYSPFDSRVNKEESRFVVSGAVLLVKKDIYFEVGGLDEDYNYGYEDADFSLKLINRGYVNMYCPTALVFHYSWGTKGKEKYDVIRKIQKKNIEIFYDKWHEWLKDNFKKKNQI